MKKTKTLHKNNPHNQEYNFDELCASYPALKEYVLINKYNNESIDFFNTKAVLALNKSLLKHYYQIEHYDLPEQHLIPPIPGRADYIHYLAQYLMQNNNNVIPKGEKVKVLDIGTGANCIYPIIASSAYEWDIVASDSAQESLNIAKNIVSSNASLKNKVEFRFQNKQSDVLKNIVSNDEYFMASICNPPFHKSQEDASAASSRKIKNLKKDEYAKTVLNFSGTASELWCQGGEVEFISKLISQSTLYKKNFFCFSTLVSKKEHLSIFERKLKNLKAIDIKTLEMKQGQKISRILVWSFLSKKEKQVWLEQHL